MKKWEYKWIPGTRKEISDIQEVLGEAGWKCYAVTSPEVVNGMSIGSYTAWMKRELEAPDAEEQRIDMINNARKLNQHGKGQ